MADELLAYAAWFVAGIGAINWGAEAALNYNLVTDGLKLASSQAEAAYLIVGVAGVINLYLLVEEVM
jgi:uncharacterized membrane protein YuzA (DUF378 family)